MLSEKSPHSFHIPVMGTGFTIDTPIKVAHYGISSVISIIDHKLTEQMRKYYSELYDLPFTEIDEKEEDARAKRFTAYLDLVQEVVTRRFNELKNSPFVPGSEITNYLEMLADDSPLKQKYQEMLESEGMTKSLMELQIRELLRPGEIDVNIMTKVDGANKAPDNTPLPVEYNDAHAALRGFANSTLSSSVVFSAGLNPRLYSYIASFDDFFPDENGTLKKKVILKVSDYRSALIQGKFLAKKGIWVSEFRVESGLNCGGHAFATDGYLMGPILDEFHQNKKELSNILFEIYADALQSSGRNTVASAPKIKLTVQGGVGTSHEHQFLLDYYGADSVGWGSPFLLVPEAVSIDNDTLKLLVNAKEEDYYLSGVSPLGVPFNTVRNSTAELEKQERVSNNQPGAPCVKKHLAFNTEFTEEPICVASLKYQRKKIDELIAKNLNKEDFNAAFEKIIEKLCLCVGLGNGALIDKEVPLQKGTQGTAVCPGPNTAYFSRVATLKEMVDHIYGRINLIVSDIRPNMFVKELSLYIKYLKNTIEEIYLNQTDKQAKYIQAFIGNLMEGISYYEQKLPLFKGEDSESIIKDLLSAKLDLSGMELEHA